MKILFVCKYNRFRSRIAEAYFKKINKNIKAESAGLIEGWTPLDKNEVKTAKELGLDIEGKPRALSTELLKQQDKIIIISDEIPSSIFDEIMVADNTPRLFNKENKVEVWKIPDIKDGNKKTIERTIRDIIKKIDELNKQLEKN